MPGWRVAISPAFLNHGGTYFLLFFLLARTTDIFVFRMDCRASDNKE